MKCSTAGCSKNATTQAAQDCQSCPAFLDYLDATDPEAPAEQAPHTHPVFLCDTHAVSA